MTKSLALAGAGWLALCAAAATAQTTITGVEDVDDRITDIEEVATDEIERADETCASATPRNSPASRARPRWPIPARPATTNRRS